MPAAPQTFTTYKFISDYEQSYCKVMGGTGVTGCLEYASRNFKVGDTLISSGSVVSDGINPPFINGQLYGAGANGGAGSIPLSVLKKVSEQTGQPTLDSYMNSSTNKSIFTVRNIIIVLLIIGIIAGILKFAKAF